MRIGLGLGLTRLGGGFNPASIFGVSDIGWVEPMIPGVTLFQDAAGTTPVTAPGQPVGLSKFTAGGQLGFVQSTALNRPIYQVDAQGRGYLSHNGSNQWMSTAAFAWGSDKATIVAGVRKLSDAVRAMVFELGVATSPAFFFEAPSFNGGANYEVGSAGSVRANARASGISAPNTSLVTGTASITSDLVSIRVNGSLVQNTTADQGSGTAYADNPLYAGARGGTTLFFNGNRYPSFGINRLLTAGELSQVEAWVNSKTGAY